MRGARTRRVKTRRMRHSRRVKTRRMRRSRRVYKMRGGWGGAISSPPITPPLVMKGGWGGMPPTTNPV